MSERDREGKPERGNYTEREREREQASERVREGVRE